MANLEGRVKALEKEFCPHVKHMPEIRISFGKDSTEVYELIDGQLVLIEDPDPSVLYISPEDALL